MRLFNLSKAEVAKKANEEMNDSSAKVLLKKTTGYLYDEKENELASNTGYLRLTGGL